MQLRGATDLGLRIVMRLAVLNDDETTTTEIIADELGVRYSHATKIVAALWKMGVVETRRGRGGGLRLAVDARSISVGRIARILEGPGEVVTCEGSTPCPLRGGCRLRSLLREAQEAFFVALDRVTIADLAVGETRQLLLTIGSRPA